MRKRRKVSVLMNKELIFHGTLYSSHKYVSRLKYDLVKDLGINYDDVVYAHIQDDKRFGETGLFASLRLRLKDVLNLLDWYLTDDLWDLRLTEKERDFLVSRENIKLMLNDLFVNIKKRYLLSPYFSKDEFDDFLNQQGLIYKENKSELDFVYFLLSENLDEIKFSKESYLVSCPLIGYAYDEKDKHIFQFLQFFIKEIFFHIYQEYFLIYLQEIVYQEKNQWQDEINQIRKKLISNNLNQQQWINQTIQNTVLK